MIQHVAGLDRVLPGLLGHGGIEGLAGQAPGLLATVQGHQDLGDVQLGLGALLGGGGIGQFAQAHPLVVQLPFQLGTLCLCRFGADAGHFSDISKHFDVYITFAHGSVFIG